MRLERCCQYSLIQREENKGASIKKVFDIKKIVEEHLISDINPGEEDESISLLLNNVFKMRLNPFC